MNKLIKCPNCVGRRQIVYENQIIDCVNCNGTGTVKPIKKRIEKIGKTEPLYVQVLAAKINELINAYNLDK